jgi:hypothetical protein
MASALTIKKTRIETPPHDQQQALFMREITSESLRVEVFGCLPMDDYIVAGRVCRAWNSLLTPERWIRKQDQFDLGSSQKLLKQIMWLLKSPENFSTIANVYMDDSAEIEDGIMVQLATKLPNLLSIHMGRNAGFASFFAENRCPRLDVLGICTDLASTKKLVETYPRIEAVWMARADETDSELGWLSLPPLQNMSFSDSNMSDELLLKMETHPNLRQVCMDMKVSAKIVESLSKIPKLENLEIHGIDLDDQRVDWITQLNKAVQLESLTIWCLTTASQVFIRAQLQNLALPHLQKLQIKVAIHNPRDESSFLSRQSIQLLTVNCPELESFHLKLDLISKKDVPKDLYDLQKELSLSHPDFEFIIET